MNIRNAVAGVLLGLPLLNGCAARHDESLIEEPLETLNQYAPGVALYDGNKNNRLDTDEALNYIRARILPEHGKNGQLTDKVIIMIKEISSRFHQHSKNYHGTGHPFNGNKLSTGPIIANYRDTAKAFDDALDILFKEEKDTAEKLVKSEKK